MSSNTIAIIGAGPAGLVSAKEALENGLLPVIFEKCGELGGVWKPSSGAVWPTMKTNVSKFNMSFSDSPIPSQEDLFMTAPQVHKYFLSYAEKWGLGSSIQYNCEVIRVQSHSKGSGGWTLYWKDAKGDAKSQHFQGLIVASGCWSIPYIPKDIKGLEEFPGIKIHSQKYRNPDQFKDLRVLTLGGSLSSNEVISNIFPVTKELIHCFKRPFWVFKRWIPNPDHENGKLIPLDFLLFTRKFQSHLKTLQENEEKIVFFNNFLLQLCQEQQSVKELAVTEEELKKSIQFTVSDSYVKAVKDGKITVERQGLKELQGDKAILDDGKEYEIDAIIFATGYEINVSIFEEEVLEALEYLPGERCLPFMLFEGTINPKLENLHFVGVAKDPSIINFEQQARLAAKVLSGKLERPPNDGMSKMRQLRESGLKIQFPYGDVPSWTDKLANYNGSFNADKLLDKDSPLEDTFPSGVTLPDAWKGKEEQIRKLLIEGPFLASHYDFQKRPAEVLEMIQQVAEILK